MWCTLASYPLQQQPFYGPLSGTTRVSCYQKKHSPTHYPDHHPVFISLFGSLSFTLTLHIHLTILISARWSATSFSFLTGQVSLPLAQENTSPPVFTVQKATECALKISSIILALCSGTNRWWREQCLMNRSSRSRSFIWEMNLSTQSVALVLRKSVIV